MSLLECSREELLRASACKIGVFVPLRSYKMPCSLPRALTLGRKVCFEVSFSWLLFTKSFK